MRKRLRKKLAKKRRLALYIDSARLAERLYKFCWPKLAAINHRCTCDGEGDCEVCDPVGNYCDAVIALSKERRTM